MTPVSRRGHRYMFTAVCAWSGYYWAFAVEDDTSVTAARCLFMYVMCDLAGYPPAIGSDRGPAFIESVVKELLQHLGVHQVIGSAYHPQAQSPVERPHREYNSICKTFMESTQDWDLMVPIFVWTIRTTARVFSGSFTPYEIITGLKPRSPIDAMLSQPSGVKRESKEQYVRELVEYVKHVHKLVAQNKERIHASDTRRALRDAELPKYLRKGDYCFVTKPTEPGTSKRFQKRVYDEIYQVDQVHGDGDEAKAYTVQDSNGRTEGLGFSQPLAYDRLVPAEVLPLEQPAADQRTRIRIFDGSQPREGNIQGHLTNGMVEIAYDDDKDNPEKVDLTTVSYQWI